MAEFRHLVETFLHFLACLFGQKRHRIEGVFLNNYNALSLLEFDEARKKARFLLYGIDLMPF